MKGLERCWVGGMKMTSKKYCPYVFGKICESSKCEIECCPYHFGKRCENSDCEICRCYYCTDVVECLLADDECLSRKYGGMC